METYILRADDLPKPASNSNRWVEELNPAQREAVFFNDGPLLVIAGAGSGKTKTLVYRVARLISDGVPPESILLLTFTRKASQEMLRRAASVLDSRCQGVSGGTFHSFANVILRHYARFIGYESQFTVMDRSDAEDLIQVSRKELGLHKSDKRFPKKSVIANVISKCINTGKNIPEIVQEEYSQFAEFTPAIEQIGAHYATQKQQLQVFDYDDLLVKLLEILNIDSVREKLQAKYQYMMVDEYQDTNSIQAEIILRLANQKRNVMAVGDDSQSIYSFRGANFKNIMAFPKLFPGTHVITLEQNYRSTQPILDLTNAVIKRSRDKYSKTLFTAQEGGVKPTYVEADSDSMQSRFVCQRILELREKGVDLKEIAVLIRSGWHSNDLEVELAARNLPFVKHGGFKFVEAAHVKDVIAFLRVKFNPADIISWQRILLLFDGVGAVAASAISSAIVANKSKILEFNWSKFRSKPFYASLMELFNLVLDPRPAKVSQIALAMIEFYKPLFQTQYDDFKKRQVDLDSLVVIAERYDDLESFLTEMTLEPPDGSQSGSSAEESDDEKLTISTIHSAKGMEWNTVFLISAVDGLLPSFQSLDDADQIEEERRLLYVALTRAKENLFIIKPNMDNASGLFYRYPGFRFSKLCRFLEEEDLMKHYAQKLVILDESRPKFTPFRQNYRDEPIDQAFDDFYSEKPKRKYYF